MGAFEEEGEEMKTTLAEWIFFILILTIVAIIMLEFK